MARVTQFVIRGETKPGALARICAELAKVAVNITGITASQEAGQGIPMVAEPHATAAKVLDTPKILTAKSKASLSASPTARGRWAAA